MNEHELAEIIRNNDNITNQLYEVVLDWCGENIEQPNWTEDCQFLFETLAHYLMKVRLGRWTEKDTIIISKYFSKKCAYEIGIQDDNFTIDFTNQLIADLSSDVPKNFLKGLQSLYHDVTCAKQNIILQRRVEEEQNKIHSGNTYRMALETLVSAIEPTFYMENSNIWYKENQAELNGMMQALKTIRTYNPGAYGVFNQEIINQKLQQYADKMEDDRIINFGKYNARISEVVDSMCEEYINQYPEVILEIPVLRLGYNKNGSKKDILQLLKERQALIRNEQDREKIDDLYKTIINYKYFDGDVLNSELKKLDKYIISTGANDEFIFDLILFRLEKLGLDNERMTKYMKATREQAEISESIARIKNKVRNSKHKKVNRKKQ